MVPQAPAVNPWQQRPPVQQPLAVEKEAAGNVGTPAVEKEEPGPAAGEAAAAAHDGSPQATDSKHILVFLPMRIWSLCPKSLPSMFCHCYFIINRITTPCKDAFINIRISILQNPVLVSNPLFKAIVLSCRRLLAHLRPLLRRSPPAKGRPRFY